MLALVPIYFGDDRRLPAELLALCLEYAGLARVGRSSLQFRIFLRMKQRKLDRERTNSEVLDST